MANCNVSSLYSAFMKAQEPSKQLDVAVGVVFNQKEQILISQRAVEGPYPNLWELPGGKVEQGEAPATALVRELKEELGIVCTEIMPWLEHSHQYPDCHVNLMVFFVTAYTGVPQCQESQQGLRWVDRNALSDFNFPEGNAPFIELLKLSTLSELLLGIV